MRAARRPRPLLHTAPGPRHSSSSSHRLRAPSHSRARALSSCREDFGILIALQLLNAIIGFVEALRAGNAVDALKDKLAAKANCMRDGVWHEMAAAELVPGDLVEMKLGDQIPADVVMLAGNPVEVDQSGLTGESLPVEIKEGGYMMLGSMLKTGQIKAVVVATGVNTSYGEAAKLIKSIAAEEMLHATLLINQSFFLASH